MTCSIRQLHARTSHVQILFRNPHPDGRLCECAATGEHSLFMHQSIGLQPLCFLHMSMCVWGRTFTDNNERLMVRISFTIWHIWQNPQKRWSHCQVKTFWDHKPWLRQTIYLSFPKVSVICKLLFPDQNTASKSSECRLTKIYSTAFAPINE